MDVNGFLDDLNMPMVIGIMKKRRTAHRSWDEDVVQGIRRSWWTVGICMWGAIEEIANSIGSEGTAPRVGDSYERIR